MLTPWTSSRSLPVRTATTPGADLASLVSMAVIRAWANGLRTMARCSIPGSWMLSVQRVRPVISRWSSLRLRGLADLGGGAVVDGGHQATLPRWRPTRPRRRRRLGHRAGTGRHGLDDVVVAGAAAQVALEPDPDLLLGGVRVLLEHVDGLHDHARRAVAALQGVVVVEGLLHRVQLAARGDALDRGDLVPVGLHGQHVARLHAPPVEVHGAGAAVARVAADDGPHLPDRVAQVLDEQRAGFDVVGAQDSIDGDVDPSHR